MAIPTENRFIARESLSLSLYLTCVYIYICVCTEGSVAIPPTRLPSGKCLHNYGKSPCSMEKQNNYNVYTTTDNHHVQWKNKTTIHGIFFIVMLGNDWAIGTNPWGLSPCCWRPSIWTGALAVDYLQNGSPWECSFPMISHQYLNKFYLSKLALIKCTNCIPTCIVHKQGDLCNVVGS